MTTINPFLPGEVVFPRPLFFLFSFSLILIYSLSPSVYAGDSGLFTAASYFLGSAHPPAYPLFILLGKLATFIPFGNIALKVNLLSALFGALTVLLVYDTALYITKNSVLSIFAPLTVLASPNFIFESSKAEVYTLNAFLVMLIFYLGIRTLKEQDFFKKIIISSFVLGLGMGNHHTVGFMLFAILYVIIIRRKALPFGTIITSIVLFITGFSIYFYLYLRSIANTFIDYSKVYSFIDFVTIFFRADYSASTSDAIKGAFFHGAGWLYSIKNIGLLLSKDIHPIILVFVLLGIIGIVKDRRMFGYILTSVLLWLPLAKITLSVKEFTFNVFSVVSPYFLPLIPIFGVIASLGLFEFYDKAKKYSSFLSKSILIALILFQLVYISISIQKSSLSHYFVSYNWMKDISKVFKPKSFYLAFGDNPSFLAFYGLGVERLRDDVLCMDAATGNFNFRLILSPQWKFSLWYPEFYETERSSVTYFYPIAKEGKLYVSNIGSLPKQIKKKFDARPYVLVSLLLPKVNDFPFQERFKDDFSKIDYLPAVLGPKADILEIEIHKNYLFTIWGYAKFLADENSKDTDYFYRLAIFITTRGFKYEIIKDYIRFLSEKRGILATQKFIDELKRSVSNQDEKKEIEQIERHLRWGT